MMERRRRDMVDWVELPPGEARGSGGREGAMNVVGRTLGGDRGVSHGGTVRETVTGSEPGALMTELGDGEQLLRDARVLLLQRAA